MSTRSLISSRLIYAIPIVLGLVVFFTPELCFADFESSLRGIRDKITHVILPLLSVIGIALAAVSFFTGNPNSKQHIIYAILGCIFGFGAQSIVDMIRGTVQ
jgi:type IV secretory pathway VirB2 component (pilin)